MPLEDEVSSVDAARSGGGSFLRHRARVAIELIESGMQRRLEQLLHGCPLAAHLAHGIQIHLLHLIALGMIGHVEKDIVGVVEDPSEERAQGLCYLDLALAHDVAGIVEPILHDVELNDIRAGGLIAACHVTPDSRCPRGTETVS